jgi:DNA-directed RNA polymerase subunit omega
MGRQACQQITEGVLHLIYPSLDLLLKKVDSKYTLVVMTARRAREIVSGDAILVPSKSNKAVTNALEEIGADKISYERVKPIVG